MYLESMSVHMHACLYFRMFVTYRTRAYVYCTPADSTTHSMCMQVVSCIWTHMHTHTQHTHTHSSYQRGSTVNCGRSGSFPNTAEINVSRTFLVVTLWSVKKMDKPSLALLFVDLSYGIHQRLVQGPQHARVYFTTAKIWLDMFYCDEIERI